MTPAVRCLSSLSLWLDRPATYTISVPILTMAGAATTVIAPALLNPIEFGHFVLLTSVFQYVADFDFGLSRLTDRVVTLRHDGDAQNLPDDLIWARVALAAVVWTVAFAASRAASPEWRELAIIAVTGGLVFMLSNGPVAIYRAGSRIREFSISALSMQFGLTLPRLIGLMFGGVKGCLIALAGWYSLTAIFLSAPLMLVLARSPSPQQIFTTLGAGAPLFLFSTLWTLYLMSSRWIALSLTSPVEVGLFGFGANLVVIGVGVVNTVAQVYYPRYLVQANKAQLARELDRLLVVLVSGTLLGIAVCRYLLPQAFPSFASGMPTTAALLLSGLPLFCCGWIIPLVIAKARRPWIEAPVIFGSSAGILALGMVLGEAASGLDGQAWGCLPSTVLLLWLEADQLRRTGLLSSKSVRRLLFFVSAAIAAGAVEWFLVFR